MRGESLKFVLARIWRKDFSNQKGKTEEVAEYALHIQCSWRIVKGNKIVVASRDFYSPRTGLDDENEYFEWDVQGNNRFDERIEFL